VPVILVLIGKRWAGTVDSSGRRRLDDPNDYVRFEIEKALSGDIRVIPIIVEGAAVPRVEELPAGIESLARRNAIEISYHQFDFDVVIRFLRRVVA
jgi:hypothetical protein